MATVYFPVLNNYSTDNIDETPGSSECSTSATYIDNHKLDTFTLDSSIPLGLLNPGENVCFFNCVVQTLYAIPAFRAFIQELVPINEAARAIKEIFEVNVNESVRSSKYVRRLALTGYQFRHQYDAHECLLHILNKVYPTITDNCIFTIPCLESIQCIESVDGTIIGCMHEPNPNLVNNLNLTLELDTSCIQNISSMISQSQRSRAPEGYICDNCGEQNTCVKEDVISGAADVLIINLK